jgi:glycosidase
MGQKPDEDIRLPMQWTGQTENGGFSTGIPWRAPGTNVSLANVATEEKDPKSLLNHYRALILLRKNYPTLRSGSTTVLQTSTPAVFACLRSNGNQNILVLINLSDKPLTDYKISTSNADIANQVYQLEPIFGDQSASPMTIADGKIIDAQPLAELAPHSTNIFLLK